MRDLREGAGGNLKVQCGVIHNGPRRHPHFSGPEQPKDLDGWCAELSGGRASANPGQARSKCGLLN